MFRAFRFLLFCVLATVVAFGSLASTALAATPDPATFSLQATEQKIVKLDPNYQQFTALYTTPNFQDTTVSVTGGTCTSQTVTIPKASRGYSVTYGCGPVTAVMFQDKGSGSVDVTVNQS